MKEFLEKITSVKFFVIVLSTCLFYTGKLTESGWTMMVLTTTGMRLANEVASMYKDIKISQKGKK